MDSREYSWAWVTADRRLSLGPCELVFALLTAGAGNADVTLYDGENTSGDIILTLEALQHVTQQAHLLVFAYCRRGLYVDIGTNVTGCFIQWRELPRKGAG